MIKKQIESSMNSSKSIWNVINRKIGKKPLLTALAECFLKEN